LLGHDEDTGSLPTFMVFNPLRTFVEILDPDHHGCGDLVVSMLDPTTVIPLMRYKTGDRATLLEPVRVAEVLGPGRRMPFPVIALQGRAKDIVAPGLHVDVFKDALYRSRETARDLTGAFRLSRTRDGLRWELQLVRECTTNPAMVEALLKEGIPQRIGKDQVSVLCHPFKDFPYAMTLDYERKLAYWAG
jgi:phenylacetate-CoA ligase